MNKSFDDNNSILEEIENLKTNQKQLEEINAKFNDLKSNNESSSQALESNRTNLISLLNISPPKN